MMHLELSNTKEKFMDNSCDIVVCNVGMSDAVRRRLYITINYTNKFSYLNVQIVFKAAKQ